MRKVKIRKLKGANMDIDLTTSSWKIHWKQDKYPWNEKKIQININALLKIFQFVNILEK